MIFSALISLASASATNGLCDDLVSQTQVQNCLTNTLVSPTGQPLSGIADVPGACAPLLATQSQLVYYTCMCKMAQGGLGCYQTFCPNDPGINGYKSMSVQYCVAQQQFTPQTTQASTPKVTVAASTPSGTSGSPSSSSSSGSSGSTGGNSASNGVTTATYPKVNGGSQLTVSSIALAFICLWNI
ncbi:hypothetical protein HK103_006736 [Boothiomyces macroporosus]|uniref:Secreted protein n=1 Tax=Boothiomyces macroporosus TaxID=261099 RepID=A0AAD5UD80_9FUNG|nr:hypothetical protein HK103_006736 [Boothiomyces macroporosus]